MYLYVNTLCVDVVSEIIIQETFEYVRGPVAYA